MKRLSVVAALLLALCLAAPTAWAQRSYGGGIPPGTTVPNVNGTSRTVSGITDTLLSTDCGKEIIYTSASAVTVTIPQSIVPAAGTTCDIDILQFGAGKVSVNGSAVTPATLVSAHSYTATQGTAGAIIGLNLTTVSATAYAFLTGDGS